MSTLNISLPDEMRAYIDEQVAKGGYSSASEYLRELIRHDQRQKSQEALEEKLLAGLRSKPVELTDADWDAMLDEAIRKAQNKNAA